MASIPWSDEEIRIIRDNYEKVDCVSDMMVLLPGRTYNSIRTKARDLGLISRFLPTHNEEFFNEPSEINCAIAGFVAADGCVTDKGRLTINIGRKDREHLVRIAKLTEYEGNVYDYQSRFSVAIDSEGKPVRIPGTTLTSNVQIQAPTWIQDFEKHWGIVPRKTFLMKAPNISGNRLCLAYISGLIDGDGWIGVSSPESYMIGLMGTKELMTWVKQIFDSMSPLCSRTPSHLKSVSEKNSFEYKVSGVKAYWIGKLFLTLDIPRLDRKWDNLRHFISIVEGRKTHSKRMITNLNKIKPSDDVLKEFGIYEQSKSFLSSLVVSPKSSSENLSIEEDDTLSDPDM